MHTYKAFGLIIASEFLLEELLPYSSEQPDLTIKLGMVPKTFDDFDDNMVNTTRRKISKDRYFLDAKGIAKYYAEKGESIIVETYNKASFEEVKLYLLGSCMGAVLYQRKILPLHGSCINMDGKGVLLTGKSGAGKSTVATALFSKGYSMITDDVAATGIGDLDELIVYPSYPSQKLWEDALERSGRKEQQHSLIRISDNYNKFSVTSSAYFYSLPIPLKVIFEIIPADVKKLHVEEIKGVDKLPVLLRNTYRRLMPQVMDLQDWHFSQCISIATNVKAFRIIRPIEMHVENEIANMVLERCRS